MHVASDGDVVIANDDDYGSPAVRSLTKTEEIIQTRLMVYRPATGFRMARMLTYDETRVRTGEGGRPRVVDRPNPPRRARVQRELRLSRQGKRGEGLHIATAERGGEQASVFVPASPSDAVCVRSYVYLPMSAMAAFRCMSPNQSISSKVNVARHYPLKIHTLRRDVDPHVVTYDGDPIAYRDIGQNGLLRPTNIVPNANIRFDANDAEGFDDYAAACAPTLSDAFELVAPHAPTRYSTHRALLDVEALGFSNHNATDAPFRSAIKRVRANVGRLKRELREKRESAERFAREIANRSKDTLGPSLFAPPLFSDEVHAYALSWTRLRNAGRITRYCTRCVSATLCATCSRSSPATTRACTSQGCATNCTKRCAR